MAKRSRVILAIGLPMEEEPPRTPGGLLNDLSPWRNSQNAALQGGQMHCSGVMSGKRVKQEAPRIRTVSAWEAPRESNRRKIEGANGEEV
jgi:hypothetical protein